MPDIPSLHTFANGTVIDAVEANENNADIRDTFNGSIGSVLADSGQTPGRLVIVNNTGAPAYQAMSGDATISDAGVLTLAADAVDSSNLNLTKTRVTATADLTLTTSYQDIAGLTYTTVAAGDFLVFLTVDFLTSGVTELVAQLLVNGVAQTGVARLYTPGNNLGTTVAQTFLATGVGSGHVIKAQAKEVSGAGIVQQTNSSLVVVQIG